MAVAEVGGGGWRRVFGNDWRRFERHLVSTSWWWRTSLGERLGLGGQVGPFDRHARGSADRTARHRIRKTTRAVDDCDISPRIEKGPQAQLRHVQTWCPKTRHRVTGASWNQNCYVLIVTYVRLN